MASTPSASAIYALFLVSRQNSAAVTRLRRLICIKLLCSAARARGISFASSARSHDAMSPTDRGSGVVVTLLSMLRPASLLGWLAAPISLLRQAIQKATAGWSPRAFGQVWPFAVFTGQNAQGFEGPRELQELQDRIRASEQELAMASIEYEIQIDELAVQLARERSRADHLEAEVIGLRRILNQAPQRRRMRLDAQEFVPRMLGSSGILLDIHQESIVFRLGAEDIEENLPFARRDEEDTEDETGRMLAHVGAGGSDQSAAAGSDAHTVRASRADVQQLDQEQATATFAVGADEQEQLAAVVRDEPEVGLDTSDARQLDQDAAPSRSSSSWQPGDWQQSSWASSRYSGSNRQGAPQRQTASAPRRGRNSNQRRMSVADARAVLGVARGASEADLAQAYERERRLLGPATALGARATEAYNLLTARRR